MSHMWTGKSFKRGLLRLVWGPPLCPIVRGDRYRGYACCRGRAIAGASLGCRSGCGGTIAIGC